MLRWWSTCCLEVWLHDLPIGVFDCLMWSMMSVTPVCCRIQVLCLWSRRVMPSIILSIFLCATASAFIWAVVKGQVSLPYVITGSTYSLNTFFLICMLALRLLMMLSTLSKAVHPKVIRLLMSGSLLEWGGVAQVIACGTCNRAGRWFESRRQLKCLVARGRCKMPLGRQGWAIATCSCNVVLLDKAPYPRLSLANPQCQAWRVRHTPWNTTMADKWNQRPSVPSSPRVTTQGSGKHDNGAEGAKNFWVRTGCQWKLKICTYNARSLFSDDRLHELEDELDRINFDIVGICETRRKGEGCLVI